MPPKRHREAVMAKLGVDRILSPLDDERTFEAGLEMLLAGIATVAAAPGRSPSDGRTCGNGPER